MHFFIAYGKVISSQSPFTIFRINAVEYALRVVVSPSCSNRGPSMDLASSKSPECFSIFDAVVRRVPGSNPRLRVSFEYP